MNPSSLKKITITYIIKKPATSFSIYINIFIAYFYFITGIKTDFKKQAQSTYSTLSGRLFHQAFKIDTR